jgi:hypothetical protein
MNELTLVTPTYGPDLQLCSQLVESVRRFVAPGVTHLVLPDARDLTLFRPLDSADTRVIAKEEFMPRGFHRLPRLNAWVHPRLRRPVGGWLMQQLVKLNAARMIDSRCLLFVDSDVAFVRPVTARTFVDGAHSGVRTYKSPAGITADMTAHLTWSAAAEDLLGVGHRVAPLPDYISQLVSWDGAQARAMLDRIEAQTGRPWYVSVAARRGVSEYLLYGTYLDRVCGTSALAPEQATWYADTSLCHSYWDSAPLDAATGATFIADFPPDFVAVGVQSFSTTADDIRAEVIRQLSDGVLT